ncbi:MAG: prepilin-type N-terminal cleavage/methylation domain-containing protein [Dechloromonas sp.]|nr:prepilin-type N-terminal cleavage/methylation domain-containing protein [Dechloromonas sp.]
MYLPYPKTRLQQGFSLVEMMVAVAVLVILAAVAAPQMQNQITGNRVTAATNELLAALAQTRSDAIRSSQARTVDPAVVLAARLGNVTINADMANITFNANGTTNDTGQIVLSNAVRTRTITVLGSGKAFLN